MDDILFRAYFVEDGEIRAMDMPRSFIVKDGCLSFPGLSEGAYGVANLRDVTTHLIAAILPTNMDGNTRHAWNRHRLDGIDPPIAAPTMKACCVCAAPGVDVYCPSCGLNQAQVAVAASSLMDLDETTRERLLDVIGGDA